MKRYGNLFTLAVFAAAMGILEAAVVVYLRQIYYPSGFAFPLVPITGRMFSVELIREAATIVMLACAGGLAGRTPLMRFAYFIFAFGAWDLVYYAGLKLFLGWPPSLLTWDVLFLIPVTWLGPVLAPVICALTMLLFSLGVVLPGEKGREPKIGRAQWDLMGCGAALVLCTFVWDSVKLIVENGESFLQLMSLYVPVHYHWGLFCLGELLVLSGIAFSWFPEYLLPGRGKVPGGPAVRNGGGG